MRKPAPKQTTINYDDGFAESSLKLQTQGEADFNASSARALLYNLHLFDALPDVLEQAFLLGCPRIDSALPLAIISLSKDEWADNLSVAGTIIVNFDEGSLSWLSTVCYIQAINLFAMAMDSETPLPNLLSESVRLGATLREIELSAQNREHSIRGKKVLSSVSRGGATHRAKNEQRRKAVISEMNRLIESGHSISNAARLSAGIGIGTSKGANLSLYNRYAKS